MAGSGSEMDAHPMTPEQALKLKEGDVVQALSFTDEEGQPKVGKVARVSVTVLVEVDGMEHYLAPDTIDKAK